MIREKKKEMMIKGIPASPGIAIGKAMLLALQTEGVQEVISTLQVKSM